MMQLLKQIKELFTGPNIKNSPNNLLKLQLQKINKQNHYYNHKKISIFLYKQIQIYMQIIPQVESEPILTNINIRIEKDSLQQQLDMLDQENLLLIQAMLGEMIYKDDKPKIQINGSFAYVSQKAWISNATVKENILFGLPFDQKKYDEAIKFSCLKEDIKILVKGDQTMIGEKGVSLSDKKLEFHQLEQFIAIVTVDVHVGKFIMYECLKGYLKEKTRILITHALNYCQYTDHVYLMDSGTIAEQGSFSDIKQHEQFKKVYQMFYKDAKNDEELQEQTNKVEQESVQELQLEKKQSSQTETPKIVANQDEIDELMLLEDRNKGSISFEILATYILEAFYLLYF
ncbi:unnamed protein product [Paramecium sonneborni]|uniref:ABC transporter domain-containing protein n=1 Tax=Paramecium sonneborni TaxID=65129 RepID=A0A8S1RPL0_9CILI|nr:unnamed protein product [Paramecium sonneborni]